MRTTTTTTAAAAEAVGRALAEDLRPGDLVLLEGDLAAGKTTFVRGLAAGLGGDPDEVSSPTFVLVQVYPCRRGGVERLYHVDLYRLTDRAADLRELGLEEMLSDPAAVMAVEWPRTAVVGWLPASGRLIRVCITVADDEARELTVDLPTS